MAELLVVPALIAYGEAAVAYAGELRGPGRPGGSATWGVRIGWLAQTALLAVQALAATASPGEPGRARSTSSSWLVVTALPDLGLPAALPAARAGGDAGRRASLLALAWAGGGTGVGDGRRAPACCSPLHVALMLAGVRRRSRSPRRMAALYLWEERRLKRRDAGLLRLRLPPLEALDRLAARVGARRARAAHGRASSSASRGSRAASSTRRWGSTVGDLGVLRRRARCSAARPACAAGGSPGCCSRASRSSPSSSR